MDFPGLRKDFRKSSGRAFEALQRFGELGAACLRVLAFLALALDDVFGCAFEEIGVAEFLVDARDVSVAFGHFLSQPRTLGGKIDHASKRKRNCLTSHN